MFNGIRFVLALVCLAPLSAQIGYVIQSTGASSISGGVQVYNAGANPFAQNFSFTGPTGTYQIVGRPQGDKFYFLGNNSLQVTGPNFSSPRVLSGFPATPTAMAMSPNGTQLLVGAGDLFFLDVSNPADLTVGSVTLPGSVTDIAISRDGRTAWALTNSPFASQVTAIDIATRQRFGNSLDLTGGATSLSLSPLGLLYVTATNRVFEINPATLSRTTGGEFPVNAAPSRLYFSPDGRSAYAANTTPQIGGVSIFRLDLANRGVPAYWPSNFGDPAPLIDSILVAGNNRVFAVSSSSQTLYDVTPVPFGASPSILTNLLSSRAVLGAAISNEVPSAMNLFVLTGTTQLVRVDLASNSISGSVLTGSASPVLSYVAVPPQSGGAAFLQFNNNQTVAAGAGSQPLIVRLVDGLGRPVFNAVVSFVASVGTVVVKTPSSVTNADGYAQTTVAAPADTGTFTVTASALGATAVFTLTVPGGGGGGGGPTSAIRIFAGDGQLVFDFGAAQVPLTVLITDPATGKPQSGVTVGYTVTAGTGAIVSSAITDDDGKASALFFGQPFSTNLAFQTNVVTATAPQGSVDFHVTSILSRGFDGTLASLPIAILDQPTIESGRTITARAGEALPDAVVVRINSNNFPQVGVPIPFVGIRVVDSEDIAFPDIATCLNSLSDQMGVARCTLVPSCKIGQFAAGFYIGSLLLHRGTLNITKGAGSQIKITAGNNQTGRAGQTSSQLVATVSDACGSAVAGAKVTFSVVQGSATLTNVSDTSNASGSVSALVRYGSTAGTVQVKVAIGSSSVTFNLTVEAVVTSLTLVSGSGQTAITGQAFAQPVQVQARDVQNNAVAGAQVSFSAVGGSVNPASATTDAQGRAQTTVTAGSVSGTVIVTAAAGTVSTTATLTARLPGPSVTAASFSNAASGAIGLVPCGISSVIAPGIAANVPAGGVVQANTIFGGLPLTLAGVDITVGGALAPIFSVSNIGGREQANFQTPCETAPGFTTVTVRVSGGSNTVNGVLVARAQPGIFESVASNGRRYGYVISAADGQPVSPSNPAQRGREYFIFVTGLAQVTPATATNRAGVPGQKVNLDVIVGVNSAGTRLISAEYLAGAIGVYAIRFEVPLDSAPTGDRPLAVAAVVDGQLVFGNPSLIPII